MAARADGERRRRGEWWRRRGTARITPPPAVVPFRALEGAHLITVVFRARLTKAALARSCLAAVTVLGGPADAAPWPARRAAPDAPAFLELSIADNGRAFTVARGSFVFVGVEAPVPGDRFMAPTSRDDKVAGAAFSTSSDQGVGLAVFVAVGSGRAKLVSSLKCRDARDVGDRLGAPTPSDPGDAADPAERDSGDRPCPRWKVAITVI
jgi:hypothetical protein